MKKIIFISVLFFVTCISQAQTTVTTTGGTANYVTKFSGTSTVVNSSIFDDGSKIGLFTIVPDQIFELRHSTPYARLRDNNNTTDINGTCVIEFGQESGGAWSRTGYIGDGFSGVRALGIALENSTDFLISSNANPSANPGLFFENSNQYVGINTLSPGSEFDVKGIFRLSGSTSGYVGFAPAAAAGSTTYTLPSADGTSGQVLQTNGSGTLSWLTPLTSSTGWNITGNSGLTAGTNFVGTTDAVDLVFKVNSQKAGLIDDGGPTFLGYQAGNSNTATTNTGIGYKALYTNTSYGYNTAIGYQSLYSNTIGVGNTANGYQSLYSNTEGSGNIALGSGALYSNTTGMGNTALGYEALYSNSTGIQNIAVGGYTLNSNTTGSNNTALCYYALYSNTTGTYNTALGYYALYANATGTYNTALGYNAGCINTTSGNYNTFIGQGAVANGNYSNTTAIGNGTIASSSDRVAVGNTNIGWIGGQVTWSTYSDGRFKFNVQENVKGLEFIKKLRPVTYQLNTHAVDDFLIQNMPDSIKTIHQQGMDFVPSTAIVHSGFIAQEVDSVANLCGYTSSIVHTPANSTDPYSLAYAEIVVPLVKAVQEQQKMIDSLKIHQKTTDSLLVALQNCCLLGTTSKTLQNNNSGQGNTETALQIELANNSQPILYQNEPNPFGDNTVIRYFIPENIKEKAFIAFYDMYGKEIKRAELTTKGFGNINANTENLASGIYSYSLIVNAQVIDTKKMLKQ